MPYLTKLIEMDRVGFEPTTSAAAAELRLFFTSYLKGEAMERRAQPLLSS
jgi:hypothetical protein